MKHRMILAIASLLASALSSNLAAQGGDVGTIDEAALERAFANARPYSPYAGRNFPTRPLFGDTHLHTGFSMDAGAFGARLGPADAYRFARGEEIMVSSGQLAKLSRPLDFLVVADHSDNMGFFPALNAGDPNTLAHPTGRRWYDLVQTGEGATAAVEIIRAFSDGSFPPEIMFFPGTPGFRSAWQTTIEAAEAANDPGRFTAFIGFEWTSNTGGNNLHRVVIFRDDGDRASQVEPYTVYPPLGSDNPADLWDYMQAYEDRTGGQMLAIAHNGNLSNGIMFPVVEDEVGQRMTREYAETRMRWEPLYEATQIKGDGEAHPMLSPSDEFADYEIWDKGNLDLSVLKSPEMLEFEYARSALKNGLVLEERFGINPYQFGMIGSTDSHTGLAAVEEDNFFGKTTSSEPSAERALHPFLASRDGSATIYTWETVSSGYAAVWATENTREAIWDAMARRETYATTGSRMVVRFFGGWDFAAADAASRLPANAGYTKGVPMGGELNGAPAGQSPSFLIAALKDPIGANLDRVQVVKGWLDADGEVQERVYDVAVSGGRQINADGRALASVGNTVDVENATWTNTIGAAELVTVWEDPEFDPDLRAFYYVRVIEIPTPRWTAYDAKYYNLDLPDEVPMTTTERAYTSPIWYTPAD